MLDGSFEVPQIGREVATGFCLQQVAICKSAVGFPRSTGQKREPACSWNEYAQTLIELFVDKYSYTIYGC